MGAREFLLAFAIVMAPLGTALGGVLTSRWGARFTLLLCAVGLIAVAAVAAGLVGWWSSTGRQGDSR